MHAVKKVDLLLVDNPYGTTVYFAKGLAAALEKLGVQVRLFWIDDGHFFHAFYEIIDDPPDFTCSFSDLTVAGRPLAAVWSIPHLSILVDPPIYFLHQLHEAGSWVSCVDLYDCAFVKECGFQNCFFLPHGAESRLCTPVVRDRPYDLVFFGTCIDYENRAALWPKHEKELLLAAADRVLSPAGISIAQALAELGIQGYDLPRFHGEVDQYIRGKDRVELLRSLKGHHIHIWGDGPWEKYVSDLSVHSPINFGDTLEVMKLSKVVLNSSPRFKAGSHERILTAFLCGAAVYTGYTDYLKRSFPHLLTYPFGQWENRSFSHWRECAQEGQLQVLQGHTWEERAKTLLSTVFDYRNGIGDKHLFPVRS